MVRIITGMTKHEYARALDDEIEEARISYGDESRMFEKGYDFRPFHVPILRPSFQVAKITQRAINKFLKENPLEFNN